MHHEENLPRDDSRPPALLPDLLPPLAPCRPLNAPFRQSIRLYAHAAYRRQLFFSAALRPLFSAKNLSLRSPERFAHGSGSVTGLARWPSRSADGLPARRSARATLPAPPRN